VAAPVVEDPIDDLGLRNEGDDAHLMTAAGAAQRVDLEDAPQQPPGGQRPQTLAIPIPPRTYPPQPARNNG
jgi:hypothetical protein